MEGVLRGSWAFRGPWSPAPLALEGLERDFLLPWPLASSRMHSVVGVSGVLRAPAELS